jgi:hypothetical protein
MNAKNNLKPVAVKQLFLRRSFSVLASLAALGLGLGGTAAQETAPSATAAVPAQEDRTPGRLTLNITGGEVLRKGKKVEATLAEAVDALRDVFTGSDIVVSPEVARLQLGDIKLHSSQLEDALEAMRVASGYRFVWRKGWPRPGVDPATGLPAAVTDTDLYVLDLGSSGEPRVQSSRIVDAFNLSGYLDHLGKTNEAQVNESLEQIKVIMDDTLAGLKQGFPESERPEFKFHRGANLLIVIGSPATIEVARIVLGALPGVSHSGSSSPASFQGVPSATANVDQAAAQEMFARRYGLQPPPAPGAGDGVDPARTTATSAKAAAAREAFLRRYGLRPGPGTGVSGDSTNSPPRP